MAEHSWKLLFGSEAGTSHERRGELCQDYAHGRAFCLGPSSMLVAICSDGAGSASHGGMGAKLACHALLHVATRAIENGMAISAITRDVVTEWYDKARRRLSLEACVSNLDIRDFACTLLAAFVGPDHAVFSQIGDGAIVVSRNEGYRPVFWPQGGEYVNTTYFLTGSDYEARVAFDSLAETVDEVALFTDGLQPLALHYESRSVHGPFFDPMFSSLRNVSGVEDLQLPLRQFLRSQSVNDRTDDDKTLVLATRRHGN